MKTERSAERSEKGDTKLYTTPTGPTPEGLTTSELSQIGRSSLAKSVTLPLIHLIKQFYRSEGAPILRLPTLISSDLSLVMLCPKGSIFHSESTNIVANRPRFGCDSQARTLVYLSKAGNS